jgi:hypothetical protein
LPDVCPRDARTGLEKLEAEARQASDGDALEVTLSDERRGEPFEILDQLDAHHELTSSSMRAIAAHLFVFQET